MVLLVTRLYRWLCRICFHRVSLQISCFVSLLPPVYYFSDFLTCSFLIYTDTWLPYNSWWFIHSILTVIVDNSGCAYSVDGDMRYMVYRGGFPCLNYFSRYQSHESINWVCTTGFVTSTYPIIWCLIHVHVCLCSWHGFNACSFIQIYRLKPHPFRLPAGLSSFPYVTRECHLYCSYLYISLYSRICAYQVM